MATHLGFLALVYVAASAQVVLAPRLAIGQIRPDFLLLTAMAAVLAIRGWPALVWAAAIGLVGDCLADRPLGAGMLVSTVVALFVQRRLRDRPAISVVGTAVLCACAVFVLLVAREAISAAITRAPLDPLGLLFESASVAVYSSGIGLAVHLVWRWFASAPAGLRLEHTR